MKTEGEESEDYLAVDIFREILSETLGLDQSADSDCVALTQPPIASDKVAMLIHAVSPGRIPKPFREIKRIA